MALFFFFLSFPFVRHDYEKLEGLLEDLTTNNIVETGTVAQDRTQMDHMWKVRTACSLDHAACSLLAWSRCLLTWPNCLLN